MKIAFDLSQANNQKTGIENYYHELVKAYLKVDEKNEIVLISNNATYLEDYSDKFEKIVIKSSSPNFLWMSRVAFKLRRIKADLFLSQSNFLFSVLFNKTIQVVYDLGPFIHPEFYEPGFVKKFKRQFRTAARLAKGFVTISETTRKDVVRLFPKANGKTAYIGSGLNSWVQEKSATKFSEVKEKLGIESNYVLSVGTIQPRKNYINSIRAFAEFKKFHPNYQYVIVGKKGWLYDKIYSEVESLGLEDSVIFAGFVENDELIQLYKNTKVLLNVSSFEGFGLPLIEAYYHGAQIVASEILIFEEVMKGKAVFVNPEKPNNISDGLNEAIKLTSKPSKELLDQYNWEKVADRLKESFELTYKRL